MDLYDDRLLNAHGLVCDGCGKSHRYAIERTVIRPQALESFPDFVQQQGESGKVLVVLAADMDEVYGERIRSWLSGLRCEYLVLPAGVQPQLEWAQQIAGKTKGMGCILGFGGGSVCDLARYAAYISDLPYVLSPTAMSMDGFFTSIALIEVEGLKMTYTTRPPWAIFVDTSLLQQAPAIMNRAGLGEMLSKFGAVADWWVARDVYGEDFCSRTCALMQQATRAAYNRAQAIVDGEEPALAILTRALAAGGVASQWVDKSRPIAGAEHHLTHYWVMQQQKRGGHTGMHGLEVGVGIVVIAKVWEAMQAWRSKCWDVEALCALQPDEAAWREHVRAAFGDAAEEIFAEQSRRDHRPQAIRRQIQSAVASFDALLQAASEWLPGSQTLIEMMQALGLPNHPRQLGVTRQDLYDSLLYAKEVRYKPTVLWMADLLGILQPVAKQVTQEFFA